MNVGIRSRRPGFWGELSSLLLWVSQTRHSPNFSEFVGEGIILLESFTLSHLFKNPRKPPEKIKLGLKLHGSGKGKVVVDILME